jgi:thiamine biosynthesis lipoprotein
VVALFALSLLPRRGAAQAPPAPASPAGFYVTRSGIAMGTAVQMRVWIEGEPAAEIDDAVGAKIDRAFAEFRRLEGLMTTWRPDSEISRINAAAGRAAVPVSPEIYDVIAASLEYARLSGGAFDISFYGLKGLWHFNDDLRPELPDPAEIKRRLPLINWRQIHLDPKAHSVRLGRAGMAIDLGGIGKGFAVDAAVRVLRDQGVRNGMVQAGGDLMLFGSKSGQPFLAGVRDPRSAAMDDYFAVCPLINHAFSTAGDYERGFVKNGVRYHHILDPRTGYPAHGARSVTVYAKDATTADGLDDAILILGPERGLKLIESIPDAGAIIVDADNKVHISKRLQGLVKIVHPPTPGI